MEQTDLRTALGSVIAELRAGRGLSQEDLALETGRDRSHIGEIERGTTNPTLETLERIAKALGQTVGALLLRAEERQAGGQLPTANPAYIDCSVPLPKGLTHDQLEAAINKTMAILNKLGIDPKAGDLQANIYSGAVSNLLTLSIAEVSDFSRNIETRHPDLINLNLPEGDPDRTIEIKATNRPNKGGESHNVGHGWFLVVVYKAIDGRTQIIQVEIAQLEEEHWKFHPRHEGSSRTPTASTNRQGTQKLRDNSVYLDERHVPVVRGSARAAKKAAVKPLRPAARRKRQERDLLL